MLKKDVLNFVNHMRFICENWLCILDRVINRDIKYRGRPLHKLDINTTIYNIIPFFLYELTIDEWKTIITDCEYKPNRPICFYVFNYKGELIHDPAFKLDLGGSEEELNEFLIMMRDYLLIACIDYMLDNMFYLKGFRFYLLISDKDIKNNILNEDHDDEDDDDYGHYDESDWF